MSTPVPFGNPALVPMAYLIEGILPKRKLNIIAGPSGAGKTTFVFQLIKEWSAGRPLFGHPSNPEPYIYIALDRDYDEIQNRIAVAGLNPLEVPHLSLLGENMTFEKVLAQVPPGVKVLFLDGFACICPGGRINDYRIVSDFCRQITYLCGQRDLTIIAIGHATKTKEGESFLHARHKVLGSVAWGGFSSTLMFIDNVAAGDSQDGRRRIEVLPRCAKAESHTYLIDESGLLIETDLEILVKPVEMVEMKESPESIRFYQSIPFDEDLTTAELTAMAQAMSERTAKRCLDRWTSNKSLLHVAHGVYRKNSSSSLRNDGHSASKT